MDGNGDGLHELMQRADKVLRRPGDLLLESGYWFQTPYFAVLRGFELIVCFAKVEPFNEAIRTKLSVMAEEHFEGHVVRCFESGSEVYLNDVGTEQPFRVVGLDTLTPKKMSPWEWASFGCQVVEAEVRELGGEVHSRNSLLIAPPHVWFDVSGVITLCLVNCHPQRETESKFMPDKGLLEHFEKMVKPEFSIRVLVRNIEFRDSDNDPFDPRFNYSVMPPQRRCRIKILEKRDYSDHVAATLGADRVWTINPYSSY